MPGLHDVYGKEFSAKYAEYEAAAARGEIRVFRQVKAVDLWRRMLTMLFETGHPWITFKDPCNLRSPQGHVGVVHSSNLCTEITLNTSKDEVAVCNLGSVNLAAHVTLWRRAGRRAAAKDGPHRGADARQRHRHQPVHDPAGPPVEPEAPPGRARPDGLRRQRCTRWACRTRPMRRWSSPTRRWSSCRTSPSRRPATWPLERGRYASFDGSLWSRGILPIDSVEILREHRDGDLDQDSTQRLDWDTLRAKVVRQGMRNSNVMAIAPTATISNIIGVAQSIEPTYRNLFVKSNMSGDFTVVNEHLVRVLKERGLWDEVMIADLKYFDGSLWPIERIPDDVKELFATAFEVEGAWLIKAASRRQKWIDQAQSLNLYVAQPNGRKLDELYRLAWRTGCKTTYYLRSTSKTHVEKSTLRGTDGKLNSVQATTVQQQASTAPAAAPAPRSGGRRPPVRPQRWSASPAAVPLRLPVGAGSCRGAASGGQAEPVRRRAVRGGRRRAQGLRHRRPGLRSLPVI